MSKRIVGIILQDELRSRTSLRSSKWYSSLRAYTALVMSSSKLTDFSFVTYRTEAAPLAGL
jgi:hypothetical protein